MSGREGLLEDDYTEEQVEQELAPLAIQLAYVAAASGQHRSALDQLKVASPSPLFFPLGSLEH